MQWAKFRQLAFLCRFGHQSLTELLGRMPNNLELALFEEALNEILEKEFPAPKDS